MTDTGLPGEDRSIIPGAVPNAEPTGPIPVPADDSGGAAKDAVRADARESARGRLGWVGITVAVIFGLFYVYALFAALSALVEFPQRWNGVPDAPWALPVITLLLPIAVFGLAFWVALRRNVFGKALIFILGLAAVAALTVSLTVFEASLYATTAIPL